MLINKKYKMLQLTVDGAKVNIPSVKNSYLYTIWVLKHKYLEVTLHGVTTVTYEDYLDDSYRRSLLETGGSTIPYNVPSINPMVDVTNINSIIVGLGTDAVLILGDFSYTELIKTFRSKPQLVMYSECSTYFDNHIIKLQIEHPKVKGVAPKLHEMNYYLYTTRNRRAFNRQAEHVRKLLKVESNIRKKENNNKNTMSKVTLTPVMREYYESQLHEFVYTYIYKGKTSYGKQQ